MSTKKTEENKEEEEFKSHHGTHHEEIHDIRPAFEQHKTAGIKPAKKDPVSIASTSVTGLPQADKLELSNSGNDLSVASIAKLANRGGKIDDGEVVIKLH